MPIYREGNYFHDTDDFSQVMTSAGLTAHLDAIVDRAGAIAHTTAREDTGQWKDSFVVGTAVEDHKGLRVVGFLLSTDPDAIFKEFGYGSSRTMNDAMSQAAQT